MVKLITVECKITDPAILGWGDRIAVFFDNIFQGHFCARRPPNPYKRLEDGSKIAWSELYAFIAPGEYNWRCWDSPKHGKCLLLNEGGAVPTANANPNHDFKNAAYNIEVHQAYSMSWPGSAGCTTIKYDDWDDFIRLFREGDTGKIAYIEKV
jgi:hypothetical protein